MVASASVLSTGDDLSGAAKAQSILQVRSITEHLKFGCAMSVTSSQRSTYAPSTLPVGPDSRISPVTIGP